MGRLRKESRERLRAMAKNDLEASVELCIDVGLTEREALVIVGETYTKTPAAGDTE